MKPLHLVIVIIIISFVTCVAALKKNTIMYYYYAPCTFAEAWCHIFPLCVLECDRLWFEVYATTPPM